MAEVACARGALQVVRINGRRGGRALWVRRLVRAGVLMTALALCGCYSSSRLLLDPEAAVRPLEDGVYERDDADHERVRLTQEPDGWYGVETIETNGVIGETRRALFNALPLGALKAYAVAQEASDGWTYAVVVTVDERVYLATPDCADPLDASLAVDHGGVQADDDAMTHNCLFKDPGALMAALSAYAGQAEFGAPYLRK